MKVILVNGSPHEKGCTYEWQSPKRPKLMEAILVHYADVMEAEAMAV